MQCMPVSGWSALSAAACAGHTAAVRCLLEHVPELSTVATRDVFVYATGLVRWCFHVGGDFVFL